MTAPIAASRPPLLGDARPGHAVEGDRAQRIAASGPPPARDLDRATRQLGLANAGDSVEQEQDFLVEQLEDPRDLRVPAHERERRMRTAR
jgi:hypothetical protein